MVRTYETTRDVLDHAKEFHSELAERYQKGADQANRKRVQMLLYYLARHERHLAESLTDYEEDASERVLDTWFKFVPSETRLKQITALRIDPDMSLDQIVLEALRMDDCLIDLYRDVANISVAEEVKAVFNNLLELEEQEKHRLVRNAMMANDF